MAMEDCRPLGFLIGLPFALVALVLSLIGAVIWTVGFVPFFSFLPKENFAFFFILHNVVSWFPQNAVCICLHFLEFIKSLFFLLIECYCECGGFVLIYGCFTVSCFTSFNFFNIYKLMQS